MTEKFDSSLFIKAKEGDKKAQDEFIEKNKGLVHLVVKKFSGRGIETDELIQLGLIGLYKALMNFNENYGVQFSTYAVPLIMGEIKRFIRDDGAIKVSRSLKELYSKIRFVKDELEKKLGRNPKITEIAKRLDVTTEEVIMSLNANERVWSLEEEIKNKDKQVGTSYT